MNDGGPAAFAAITGTPHAIASMNTWPKDSAIDGMTITSVHASPAPSSEWPRQPTKNTSSMPSRSTTVCGCSPSHSPGKPPQMTSGARRSNRCAARA